MDQGKIIEEDIEDEKVRKSLKNIIKYVDERDEKTYSDLKNDIKEELKSINSEIDTLKKNINSSYEMNNRDKEWKKCPECGGEFTEIKVMVKNGKKVRRCPLCFHKFM